MRTGYRAALSALGLLLLLIGLGLAIGGFATDALRPPDAGDDTGLVVAFVGIALGVGGWLCEMIAFPTATAITGLGVMVMMLVVADVLIVTATIVQKATPDSYDPIHAAQVLWLAALVCLAIAAALLLVWFIWRRTRGAALRVRHALAVIAVGVGALLFLSGCFSGLQTFIGLRDISDVESFDMLAAVLAGGQAALFCAAGGILLWHGAALLTDVPSTPVRSLSPWLPFAIACLVIGLGEVVVQSGTGYQLAPFMHATAVLAPGAALLALVLRFGRRAAERAHTTWRQLLLMIAYGAAGAATIAGVINTMVLYTVFFIRLAANGAFDGIVNTGDFLDRLSHADDYLAKSELVVLLLLVIAVLAPLNEEFWKGFGVRLMRGSAPTRYQAFLFGVASGVGFGMAEAQEYGAGAFSQSPYRWWYTMLLRGGSSGLHALASGIIGLAWFYAFRGQRRRAFGLFLIAVGMHGTWNGLNVLIAVRVLPGFRSLSDTTLEFGFDIFLGLLALAIIVALCRLSEQLAAADEPSAPQVGGPSADEAAPFLPRMLPFLAETPESG